MAEKEAQRRELAQRCDTLEARLAPLDADVAELQGKLQGVEKRLKEADKARANFEWRSRSAVPQLHNRETMVFLGLMKNSVSGQHCNAHIKHDVLGE